MIVSLEIKIKCWFWMLIKNNQEIGGIHGFSRMIEWIDWTFGTNTLYYLNSSKCFRYDYLLAQSELSPILYTKDRYFGFDISECNFTHLHLPMRPVYSILMHDVCQVCHRLMCIWRIIFHFWHTYICLHLYVYVIFIFHSK